VAAKPRAKANGEGTLYYDETRSRWVGQKYVRTLDGRTKRITARARTKAGAMDALRLREREVAGISAGALHTTVEAFLLAWLEHKAATVKARTHREYQQVITDHVIPAIGPLAIGKLKPIHVQRVIDDLGRVGKRATAFNCRRYLKQAFAQAVEWEYLARNPVLGVARVDVPEPKRGLWTLEQTTRFLTYTRSHTRYHALFLTAIVTGLRQGELVALPWANVTPTGVRVDRTWSKDEVEGYDTPKTRHAYRVVPISPEVFAEVERARAGTSSDLAFPSEAGTMLLPWNVHRAFVDFADAAGVPRIRFHDARRIAATLWARQGVEPKVIQQLLGHSTPHLALSVYQGVLDERVDAARLDAWMLFGGYAVFPGGQLGGAGDGRDAVPERVTN
jgi:integrase